MEEKRGGTESAVISHAVTPNMERTPILPIDRGCDGCRVCCHVLQVNDTPGGPKPAGVLCPWLHPASSGYKGCSIYKTRPHSCQSFECLYLKLARRPDIATSTDLRPDNSGVMFVHSPMALYFTAYVWDPERKEAFRDPEPSEVIKRLTQDGFKVIVTWGNSPQKLLIEADGLGGLKERVVDTTPVDQNGEQKEIPDGRA